MQTLKGWFDGFMLVLLTAKHVSVTVCNVQRYKQARHTNDKNKLFYPHIHQKQNQRTTPWVNPTCNQTGGATHGKQVLNKLIFSIFY
jgi:hypothetical protein